MNRFIILILLALIIIGLSAIESKIDYLIEKVETIEQVVTGD